MDTLDILIRRVVTPFRFWGVKTVDFEDEKFAELYEEIKSYYADEQIYKALISNPSEGMRCIVRSDTNCWDRARIEMVVVAPKGFKYRCFLLDKIESIILPASRLFVSPEWVWQVPSRGIKFCLHGITPLSLKTNYVEDTVRRSANATWSTSAIEYFQKMIRSGGDRGTVEIERITDDGVHHVNLYVKHHNMKSRLFVNEILIKRKYAIASLEENIPVSPLHTTVPRLDEHENRRKEASSARNKDIEAELELIKSIVIRDENHDEVPSSKQTDTAVEKLSPTFPSQSMSPNVRSPHYEIDNITDMPCVVIPKSVGDSEMEDIVMTSCVANEGMPKLPSNAPRLPGRKHESNNMGLKTGEKNGFKIDNDYRTPHAIQNSSSSVRCIASDGRGKNPFKLQSFSFAAGAGRGKSFLKFKQPLGAAVVSNPPPVQRKIPNGDLSLFCMPPPMQSHGLSNQMEDLSEKNQEFDKLVSEVRSYSLTDEHSNKLDKIIFMSGTQNAKKQTSSDSALKIAMLEKLLAEVKEKGCHRTVSSKCPSSPIQLQLKQEFANVVMPKLNDRTKKENETPEKKEKNAEKSFFTSGMTLVKSQQKSGVILVKGVDPPDAISLFCAAPFPQFIVSAMQAMKYRGPYYLQAYAWPAILARRNLVALGPIGGGKTLAYVAPIASMLLARKEYVNKTSLTKAQATYLQSQSPPVIVLCSSWKNVKVIVDYFERFLKDPNSDPKDHHRVIAISGGPDAENANALNLLSGCSVLICSPYTFIRLYQANQLSLSRLEQLVLDDFHILVEEFTIQIKQIMQFWLDTLNDPDRPVVPSFKPQIMCFGIQWTRGVEKFMDSFMTSPLLLISDPLEASVYGQVDHRVKMLKNHFLFDQAAEFLRSVWEERTGAVAMHVCSIATMKQLSSALKKIGYSTMEVHNSMPEYELQFLEQYNEELSTAPVLVVCDNALSIIDFDSVEVAINYDFPPNGEVLGMRMSMMRHFYQIKKGDSSSQVRPRSYILLSENSLISSLWLIKFLSRLSQPVPPLLEIVGRKCVESQEIGKTQFPLCPFLKAYGRCQDAKVCSYRHWLSAKLDAPNSNSTYAEIPTAGQVRILITSVKNATFYYGRLLKIRKADTVTSYENVYQNLCEELNQIYSDNERKLHSRPVLGHLYALKVFGQYHRAQVVLTPANKFKNTKTVCWETPGGVTKTRVHLVDTGAYIVINIDQLLELDPKYWKIPFQAIEVRSCYAKPIDQDTEWLFSANKLLHDLICGKEVEGNIKLALSNTIWLEPVLVRTKLPKSGVYVTECNAMNELLQSNLAEKSPTHLDFFKTAMLEAGMCVKPTSQSASSSSHDASSVAGDDLDEIPALKSNAQTNETEIIQTPNGVENRPYLKAIVDETGDAKIFNNCDHDVTSVKPRSANVGPVNPSPIQPQINSKEINKMQPATYSAEVDSYDGLPPLPPLVISPSRASEAISNELSIRNRVVKVYEEADSTDAEQLNHKNGRSRHKTKATPRRHKARNNHSRSMRRREDWNENPTDHDISSSTLSDSDASSTTILTEDSCLLEDSEKTPTGPAHSSMRMLSSSEVTPTNEQIQNTVRRRTPSQRRSFRTPRGTPSSTVSNASSSSKTPPDVNLCTKPPSMVANSSLKSSSSSSSSSNPLPSSVCMPPLISSDESKSGSCSSTTSSTAKPIKTKLLSKQNLNEKISTTRNIPEKALKAEDLPPRTDCNAAGIVYPLYVQLIYADNLSLRLLVCENIYIQASENYALVSNCDMESLNKALLMTRNLRETTLILSTFLSLANSFVPVEEFVCMPDIISRYCIKSHPNNANLPKTAMYLCWFILDNLIEKYPEQITDLTNALITYLDLLSSDSSVYDHMIPIVTKVMMLLQKISETAKQSFISGDRDRLAGTLTKLPPNVETDDLRKCLFEFVSSDYEDEQNTAKDVASTAMSTVSSAQPKKTKPHPAKKVYDPLNYDRFNNIDTDSDSSVRSRPYTPIPVRFDSEPETSVVETDTDTDFLPGM